MNIRNDYPPNYQIIKSVIPVEKHTIYTYGDIIYNPSGIEIPEDVILHEEVHARQQKDPQQWWNKFLEDKDFRLDQELEAFAYQYLSIKTTYPSFLQNRALDEFAEILSKRYNLGITKSQAETKIRKRSQLLIKELQHANLAEKNRQSK